MYRWWGAMATTAVVVVSSMQPMHVVALNRGAAAFIPGGMHQHRSSPFSSHIRNRGVSRIEAVVCWAKRSESRKKRNKSSGPLGPSSTTAADEDEEEAALPLQASNADESPLGAGGEETTGRVGGSRANKGTGFGQAPAKPVVPTGKQVDEAYEKAMRKLKNKGSSSTVSFDGVEPGPGVGDKKEVVARNIDIFDLIPEPIQEAFERVLIAALSVDLLLLLALGIGFSFQALPSARSLELSDGIREAALQVKVVVEKYEYLFNPSLVVFFALSSILGSFKVAQIGRGGTTTYTEYSEDDDDDDKMKKKKKKSSRQ